MRQSQTLWLASLRHLYHLWLPSGEKKQLCGLIALLGVAGSTVEIVWPNHIRHLGSRIVSDWFA
jgi:hypothetical protein